MKKLLIGLCALFTVPFFSSCPNPYVIHNLERPVYLTGIEVRSDKLESEDPSHPLDQVFHGGQTFYTVVVPFNAEIVTINGFPEEGAEVSGERSREFDLGDQHITFEFLVSKPHRESSVYTIQVIRGLPEALLAEIEVFIGDAPDNGEDLETYEHFIGSSPSEDKEENFLINFAPTRNVYTVKVPAYTNHLALLVHSFNGMENRVNRLIYEFKNWEGKTIGADGKSEETGYQQVFAAGKIFKGPLPGYYSKEAVDWGHLQFFPGGGPSLDASTWFGSSFATDPQNPRGPGKIATIEITAQADNLSDKKYIIEIQRELSAAYLDNIEVLRIKDEGTSTVKPGNPGSAPYLPRALDGSGNGAADTQPNRVIGSFARTSMGYDAALPDDTKGVRVIPRADRHLLQSGKVDYTFIPYYYSADGIRWYIDASGGHQVHPVQVGDIDEEQEQYARKFKLRMHYPIESVPGGAVFSGDLLDPDGQVNQTNIGSVYMSNFTRPLVNADGSLIVIRDPRDNREYYYQNGAWHHGVDFYFNVSDPAFQNYVRMEVVIKVESVDAAGSFVPKTYRVMSRRQKQPATLHDISIHPFKDISLGGTAFSTDPFNPATEAGNPNVFDVDGTSNTKYNRRVAAYTQTVEAGTTHARIFVDNDGGALPGKTGDAPNAGTGNRIISIVSPAKTWTFTKSGTTWLNEYNIPIPGQPWADVELKSRNTVVLIRITDVPNFAVNDYILNIITRTQSDIIVPQDSENDGVVRAVFADGPDIGLNATRALPGQKIKLTVSANLGWYIDDTRNDSGFYKGLHCISGGLASNGLRLESENGVPSGVFSTRSKDREYTFYMPDSNVQFEVAYKPTATSVNEIAYVAAGVRRGGGFGSGADGKTGKSWGTASNDLQAVINSWNGSNYKEIWVHRGTYTPPDPAAYVREQDYPGADPNCYPNIYGNTAQDYRVNGYRFTGLAGKEDIAFVLRPGIQIRGGFDETDDSADRRYERPAPEQDTILSGDYQDGVRAHHVVLAIRASGAWLECLTIAGGIGPETASDITVEPPDDSGVGYAAGEQVNRYNGGGLYNINSYLTLTDVRIRNNKSGYGGGMYTLSRGERATTEMYSVSFFGNTALQSGGGMYNARASSENILMISQDPVLNRPSSFEDNKCVHAGGGLVNSGVNSTIINTRFYANSADQGGGIYITGGDSNFSSIQVYDNWSSGDGTGIYNYGNALFYNMDLYGNRSSGGSGAGIFNAGGVLEMTNVTLRNNTGGSCLSNGATALLANVTIRENTGAGIANTGKLIMANTVLWNNSGVGLANSASEPGTAFALLVNATIDKNGGGGIANYYEGSGDVVQTRSGSVNVLLQNTRITQNTGAGISNNYTFISGYGINLALNNTTVANNTGAGISTTKGGAKFTNYPYNGVAADEEDPDKKDMKALPVYIRFRNSVVYGNGGTDASLWPTGSYGLTAADTPNTPNTTALEMLDDRETYGNSALQNKALESGSFDQYTAAKGNLDGTGGFTLSAEAAMGTYNSLGFTGFRPTGALNSGGSSSHYPASSAALLNELCWNIGGDGTASGLTGYTGLPVFIGSIQGKDITYFMDQNNSFNVGDLRNNSYQEGPKTGKPDTVIGAYK